MRDCKYKAMKADAEEKSDETNAVIGNENLIASFVVWFNCLGSLSSDTKVYSFWSRAGDHKIL